MPIGVQPLVGFSHFSTKPGLCGSPLHHSSPVSIPVTGGQIGVDSGWLDPGMSEAPTDLHALEVCMNALIDRDLAVTADWSSDEELAANPRLIKIVSVSPPSGQGRV